MSYSSEVLADSPLGYWRLGESSGTVAADSSGNGRDATYLNGPTLGVAGLLVGDTDKAVQLDANSGQCASVSSPAWMNALSQFTVEAVVSLSSATDTANGDALVSRYSGGGFQVLLWRTTGGRFGIQTETGGVLRDCTGATPISFGTVYHVAATWDGTTVRLYVNGALDASLAAPGALTSATANFEIGRYSAAAVTTPGGVIDDVAFYGSALSATRIAAHYAAATGAAPPEVTGDLAAALPALSASLTGGIETAGTITATLPSLGADLAGTSLPPGIVGSLAATLPPLGGSLAGAYADTAILAAILPPLTADLAGTVLPPLVTGTIGATLPGLTASLAGSAFEPGTTGFLAAQLPALSASLSADVLGRAGLGLLLDSDAAVIVEPPLAAETTPAGAPSTALHVVAPTVPVPTLVAGRPQ